MSAHAKMSATQKCRRMPKCQLLKNVGACQNVSYLKCRRMVKCQLLKMSALKKYSKFKSKCAYINYSKSKNTSAYMKCRRPNKQVCVS